MFKRTWLLDAAMLAVIWLLMLPSAAQAYFDLGTGTYLIQLLIAFAATAWFSVKRVFVGKPKLVAKSTEPSKATEEGTGTDPSPTPDEKGEASV